MLNLSDFSNDKLVATKYPHSPIMLTIIISFQGLVFLFFNNKKLIQTIDGLTGRNALLHE